MYTACALYCGNVPFTAGNVPFTAGNVPFTAVMPVGTTQQVISKK